MTEFHFHLFLFDKPKSNKKKEHWSKKRDITLKRKQSEKQRKENLAKGKGYKEIAAQKKRKENVSLKSQFKNLTSNLERQSVVTITQRNFVKLVIRNTYGGVKKILKTDGILIEYPKGVNKAEYKNMLNGEIVKRTSARKSATQNRKKLRFGKRAKTTYKEK